jgi:hypothetical protein
MFVANRVRDEQLMKECLWLMEFVMEKRPDIRSVFSEPQANF